MPTVSHVVPWMYKDDKLNNKEDVFTNNKLNNSEEIFTTNKETIGKDNVNNFKDSFESKDVENVAVFEKKSNECENKACNDGLHFEKVNVNCEANIKHTTNNSDEQNKRNNLTIDCKNEIEFYTKIGEINRDNDILTNDKISKNEIELNTKIGVIKRDSDILQRRVKDKKSKWRLSSGVLVTLVILNVAGQGVAVEVISTSTLASLLGYPSTCTLGAEVHPCTLSLTCWLRGGTRVRGCGGWLFACCQPQEETWNSVDNSIPSSDWQYKVSPPRLRQVPQRNVMPNNVFRRRVDDEITHVDCGVPSNRILQKRIIGGREARFAEFPWQAHVRISEFQCGGVLVSQRYVATAAHCVSRAHIRDIVVWLGALDTSAGSHTAMKVGVYQKILHPLFQFRMTQPDRYDIALLKLSRPIPFTRHIRAICLPDASMMLRGRSALIAGWGKTDATDTHTGTNMLRSATVPILSKEQCITWHQSKQINVEIHSEMICAGHSDGHQDACLGDSGGPLIVSEHGRYYLVGITSAGFGCGVDHQPGIYHNVLVTADWIRRVLDEESYERNNYIH